MQNTLFDRNWATLMPNLDEYEEKTLIPNGVNPFYAQNDFVKAYARWSSPVNAKLADLAYILNSVEIKGWITYVGNFDPEDNTFVIFTTFGVYFARLDHGNSYSNIALRIGEQYCDRNVERNYFVFRPMASGTICVSINASMIRNFYTEINAEYTNDSQGACASLRIRGEHIDYDVDIFCKKENNQARIIESNNMRSKMEMFFLNAGNGYAFELYHAFIQEVFEGGVRPGDIEVMKIKVYQDSQFVSEILIERAELKIICFMDHDELWRICSNGTWDFTSRGDVISWVWKDSKHEYELVSNLKVPSSSDDCTEQTLAYAYVIKKALAYLNLYYGFKLSEKNDNV